MYVCIVTKLSSSTQQKNCANFEKWLVVTCFWKDFDIPWKIQYKQTVYFKVFFARLKVFNCHTHCMEASLRFLHSTYIYYISWNSSHGLYFLLLLRRINQPTLFFVKYFVIFKKNEEEKRNGFYKIVKLIVKHWYIIRKTN